MSPEIETILTRLDRADDKRDIYQQEVRKQFDELRAWMMTAFVLKAVFEAELKTRDMSIESLQKSLDEHVTNEMTKPQRFIAISGGALGIVTALISIIEALLLLKK